MDFRLLLSQFQLTGMLSKLSYMVPVGKLQMLKTSSSNTTLNVLVRREIK